MASDWNEDILSNIAEVIDSRHKTPVYSDSGYPMVRVVDVNGGALNLENTKRVSDEVYEDFSRGRDPEVGDLVISRVGSYGVVSYVNSDEKFCLGQNTAFIIPKINSRFLYYQLISPFVKWQIEQFVVGAVQKTISLKSIRQFQIKLPPEPEQKAIAHILGFLDDKIELNRQMNETLEAMAQALFKSWFVDFDPVIDNALAAGNTIPDEFIERAEQRKAIEKKDHSDNQSLFPNEFEFTEEMGWIPKGWVVDDISTLCEKIQSGGTPRRNVPEYWEDSTIPWLTSGEVKQTIIIKAENKISESGLSNSSAKWLTSGATVVAMYGATAGQVAYIDKPLTTNQAVCGLIPKKGYQFFNYVTLSRAVAHFEGRATGSAQQNINKGMIESTRVVVPSSISSDSFEEYCEVIFSKWIKNLHENETLAKLRDTLLPKLMSGELRIPDTL